MLAVCSLYFALCRSKVLAELYPRDADFYIVISHFLLYKFFAGKIAKAESQPEVFDEVPFLVTESLIGILEQ